MKVLRFILPVAAGILIALSATAESKRPMTHEDLWLMRRLSALAVSPDGKDVVVSVSEPAYDSKEETSDLWIMRTDRGLAPRRLTSTKGSESGAVWHPDGGRIAFSHKAEGQEEAQIFVLNVYDGKATQLTSVANGARSPKWSPDGSTLLFLSDVFPGALTDAQNREAAKVRKERKTTARVYDGFPVRYWDRWLDDRKTHLFVQEARPDAPARDLFAEWDLAQLPGFAGRYTETAEVFDCAWAPDGSAVVFAATTERDRSAHAFVTSSLFVVPVSGGTPVRLTEDDSSFGEPVFAPDGTWFVVGEVPGRSGKVYVENRLVRFPWPFDASGRKALAEGFDRNARTPFVSPDGSEIFFTAEDAGREKIYRLPSTGGAVSLFLDPIQGVVTSLVGGGSDAPVLAGIVDAAHRPPEVAIFTQKNGVQRISGFNAERVKDLDLPPVEEFWFTSSKGRRIHSYIARPSGFDPSRKYPVFVVMHGGPHSMYRDSFGLRWNYHLLAGSDYVLILTNYTGSTGFGEEFAQRIQGDPLKTPGEEIIEALDAALLRYSFLDGSRVSAGGASYGGHLANWLQATTTRFRCLVNHAGMVNSMAQWGTSDLIYSREVNMEGPVWEQGEVWLAQNPARFAGRNAEGTGWVTPMLVTVGEKDYRVPLNNSLETWSYLKRLQIPSRLIAFPDENHWVLKGENSRFWYSEVKKWLDYWTLPAEKPKA